MNRKSRSGFTMVELLIVIAIIAILAAIAVFNYITGIQRSRQKKTMADMRSIAAAWEARASDMRGYNASGFTLPGVDLPSTDLDPLLMPTYTRSIPHNDGWGRALKFSLDQPVGGAAPAVAYAIRSAGSDGIFQSAYVQGATTKFECDIVYANGAFICYPEQ